MAVNGESRWARGQRRATTHDAGCAWCPVVGSGVPDRGRGGGGESLSSPLHRWRITSSHEIQVDVIVEEKVSMSSILQKCISKVGGSNLAGVARSWKKQVVERATIPILPAPAISRPTRIRRRWISRDRDDMSAKLLSPHQQSTTISESHMAHIRQCRLGAIHSSSYRPRYSLARSFKAFHPRP